VEEDPAYSQEYPKLTSRPQKTPVVSKTTQRRPALRAQVVSPPETTRSRSTQPYGSSYFLPGKILGKAATFLLDTGCTTNLLSRRLFDTLGGRERASLEPYEGAHGTLADGSCIPFYGVISLPGCVRDQAIHETFIVSQLKEDAILGMPFLEKNQCRMDFQKSVVVMAECRWYRTARFREDPSRLSAAESTARGLQTWGWLQERTERSDWQTV